jgi:hypothetical protein
MKTNALSTSVSLVLAISASVMAADATEPNADKILRAMSDKLAASRNFSFQAQRQVDAALREGYVLPEKARVTVDVSRPSKIAARSESKEGTRRFLANGQTLTVADERAGFYAQVPMRATLDQLVEALDKVYGFTPPLADFAISNVYKDLRRQAHTITYLGAGRADTGFLGLGGVECHRIALAGKLADAELWIAKDDQLPRKLVATFRRSGKPQVRVAFSAWNLAAPLTDANFAYTPPAGSQNLELWSKSRMQAARKN